MSIIAISGKSNSGKDTIAQIWQWLECRERALKDINHPDREYWTTISFKEFKDKKYFNLSTWKNKKFADRLKDIICILIDCNRQDLENREFKKKELGEEWWYWYMKLDGGYGNTMLDYLSTSKEELDNYDGLVLIKPTPRLLLQLLGTDCGREIIHPNLWVNALMADIDKELDANPDYNKNYKSDYIYSEPIFIKTLEGKYNLYKCCCGKEFKADKYKIKTKHTKSCGCYQKYKAGLAQFKDGRKGTRLWNIYNNMIQRCENINHPRYKDYGGRGIIVSDEFKPYENFKNWALSNGYTDTLSIDRIDNNDIYCPDNCKFSTDSEQVINTRVRKDNSSGFRGVSKDKHNWRASIQIQGKQKFLGYFNTPEEASIAYEKAFLERENLYNRKQVKKGFIITDVRFPNEARAIKDKGGILIKVNRLIGKNVYIIENEQPFQNWYGEVESYNGNDFYNVIDNNDNVVLVHKNQITLLDEHESETALDDYQDWDYVIENDGTIEDLIEKVRKILIKEKLI